MVRERIARVRYERTMTMREPKDEKAQGFESLLSEEEKAGLSEEEKMKRIAAKMEEKFKSEQRRVSVVAVSQPVQMLNDETFSSNVVLDVDCVQTRGICGEKHEKYFKGQGWKLALAHSPKRE